MRPTFYVDLEGIPQSASAPTDRQHAFNVSDVLWLIEDFETPYGVVQAPLKLFVSHIDEDEGTLWLLAEGYVPALYHWDNMIVITPWMTDDILPKLRTVFRQAAIAEVPGLPLKSLEPVLAAEAMPAHANIRRVVSKLSVLLAAASMCFGTPPEAVHNAAGVYLELLL